MMNEQAVDYRRHVWQNIDTEESLFDLSPGSEAVVQSVPASKLLGSFGIRPNKRVRVIAKGFAGGPFIVLVDQRTIAIDRNIAKRIMMGPENTL